MAEKRHKKLPKHTKRLMLSYLLRDYNEKMFTFSHLDDGGYLATQTS